MRLSSGATKPTRCRTVKRPTRRVRARSSTSTIAPSRRPRASTPVTRAITRSPCITSRMTFGGRNRSSPSSSGIKKPKAVGMTDDAPTHHVHLLRQAVEAAAVTVQLAVALHGAQPARERIELAFLAHRQYLGQGLERQRLAALAGATASPPRATAREIHTSPPRGRPSGREMCLCCALTWVFSVV